ncbi:Gfo/Idh/MocA family protein [Kocuria sp. TGY1127_2]|uniref:Gfo/Idh/MocA family protein n=1 Tax=Kocuria sp. TGY1127_2 TaxID=2711328 RepID=UPI0015BFB2AC|nr:Gfo/Idh/MocA family oxidoreductase [Kocuria sp. TGY1127_2]
MEQRELRVGIIGCGMISRNHIESYQSMKHVRVVAVADLDPEASEKVAATYEIPVSVVDIDRIWDQDLDVVSICTPHPTHEALVLAAAGHGVNVVCEKPISIDVAAASRMVAACEEAGVELTVLFQRRFWPAAQQIRAALDDGPLQNPVLGHCSVMLHRDPEYYSQDDWRGTWRTDGGGVLMTQAIHYIDLLQWFMGDVQEVFGRVNTYKHGTNIEVEDSAVATLVFATGAMATIQASTAASPALGAQVRVTGSNGSTAQLTEFPEGTDGRLDIWGEGESITSLLTHPENVPPNASLSAINDHLIPHHRSQLEDFVDALRQSRKPAITGSDSVRALKILLAIYESARTGAPVRLNEEAIATRVRVPDDVRSTTNPGERS